MKCASCCLEIEFRITGVPSGKVKQKVADIACVLLKWAGCNVELCIESGKCDGKGAE